MCKGHIVSDSPLWAFEKEPCFQRESIITSNLCGGAVRQTEVQSQRRLAPLRLSNMRFSFPSVGRIREHFDRIAS
jgi:hypothetical protein